MSNVSTAYACTDCYLLAHDSSYSHPLNAGLDYWDLVVNPDDISHTDWVCEYGELSADGDCREPGHPDDICTACDSSGTAYGITVGGACDLGEHLITGYWEHHTYTA